MDAVVKGEIDEILALLTSGIDINLTLEVFYRSHSCCHCIVYTWLDVLMYLSLIIII